jgi:Cu-Zn family superoxide dismutase
MIEKGRRDPALFSFVLEMTVLRPTLVILASLSPFLAACSPQASDDSDTESANVGYADMLTADGEKMGSAKLLWTDNAIAITVVVEGLEPGERAFHLHSAGTCDAPDFTSAGGHLNPLGRAHGSLNPDGQHLGDLPNIVTDEDGKSELTFTFSDETEQLVRQIFDADGTAVMIHAGPDDYMSDPAGAAGPRIACGVLNPAD